MDLATNRPGTSAGSAGLRTVFEVTESGVFFDGIRIADVDAVLVEIARDAVAEVKRPSRGSGPGALVGFMTGFSLGMRGA